MYFFVCFLYLILYIYINVIPQEFVHTIGVNTNNTRQLFLHPKPIPRGISTLFNTFLTSIRLGVSNSGQKKTERNLQNLLQFPRFTLFHRQSMTYCGHKNTMDQ